MKAWAWALLLLVCSTAVAAAEAGGGSGVDDSLLGLDFGDDLAAMFGGMLGGGDGSSSSSGSPFGLDSLDGTADWGDLVSSLSGLMSTPGLATPSSFFAAPSTAAPSGGAATDAAATLASLFSGSTSLASLLSSGSGAAPKLSLPQLPLSASGPFAALLRPPGAEATRGAGAQQLLDAIRQADALFHTPVLDDLFGGIELGKFLSGDRELLNQTWLAAEELETRYCKHPRHEGGEKVPTSCQGKNFILGLAGGHCFFNKDKTVVCHPARVVLITSPAKCTLHHTTPTHVIGKECKIEKLYGEKEQGYLKAPKSATHHLDAKTLDGMPKLHISGGGASRRLPRNGRLQEVLSGASSAVGGALDRLREGLAAARERLPDLPAHPVRSAVAAIRQRLRQRRDL